MKKSLGLKNKQSGVVAIFVASIIMVILALITLGFTRIMQREQRQALDRQLSRQALYASESAANEVYSKILSNPGLYDDEKTGCNPEDDVSSDGTVRPLFTSAETDIDGGAGQIQYSCVLYDQSPKELKYDVSSSESKLVELKSSSGAYSTLNISWSNSDDNLNTTATLPECDNAGEFPPTRGGTMPLLKIDLTNTSTYSRASLLSNSEYMYLAPCRGGGGGNPGTYTIDKDTRGDVVPVYCTNLGTCDVAISTGDLSSDSYLARIKPVYENASVNISGTTASGDAEFVGAQIKIDVTARANDVVRRLQINAPFSSVENPPEAVLQSFAGICKLLEVNTESGNESVNDLCSGVLGSTTYTISETPPSSSAPTTRLGNAGIGGCTSTPRPPGCGNGTPDPNAPDFNWSASFMNASVNPAGVVTGCTWEWGDGTSNDYGPTDNACTNGEWVSHDYNPPNDSRGWQSLILSTNGDQGCWIFKPKLTMRFSQAAGFVNDQEFDETEVYLPRGKANDAPNPITGEGICNGRASDGSWKYKRYP